MKARALRGLIAAGLVAGSTLALSAPAWASRKPTATARVAPPTTTPPAGNCANPTVVRMDRNDFQAGVNDGAYRIVNDTWNTSGYPGSQSISVCSQSDWWATDEWGTDSAVKTYPDVHEDFGTHPAISSLGTVTSTFAERDPHVGDYEDNYDIWINGEGNGPATELMIWNNTFNQVPAGSVVATTKLDGHTWDIWKSGNYIAYKAQTNFTSGTLTLSDFFRDIIKRGWDRPNSTLWQIDYGAEIANTAGHTATFSFTNFSITTGSPGK
jgi:hypothetical protein